MDNATTVYRLPYWDEEILDRHKRQTSMNCRLYVAGMKVNLARFIISENIGNDYRRRIFPTAPIRLRFPLGHSPGQSRRKSLTGPILTADGASALTWLFFLPPDRG
jgi:hypothetical protein